MAPSGFTSRLQREFSATRNQQHGNRSGTDRGSHPRGVYGLTRLSGTAATSTHGTKGVSTVSRNVPKPVQTSSLKKENGGQDISAVLVNRHGGPGKKIGWGSALSTPAPSAPASSLGPTPADSVNPPSSTANAAAPTKASVATASSGSESQPPPEHRPPLPPPPTESNRNVPWAMHPPSNPSPSPGVAEAHLSGNRSLAGNDYRQEKGEGSLQQNEYARNQNQSERYDRGGYGGGEQYDPSYDSGVGNGQRLPPSRSHFSREYGNERYADMDSMRAPGSSSHYQRRFPPLDEPAGGRNVNEGNYPSYHRDSRERDYYGGTRHHSDYRGNSRDYHDYRRGYHDRDRYDGGGAYRSRDRYYGNGEERRWRDDRYSQRRSYGSDYGGGYDRDRRDYRDAHSNRYGDSYATDSRRNIGSDSSRFRGYADEANDRRDGYLSDPQRDSNSRFWQDSHNADERHQIPPAPCKQNMHQPPPQNEEDIIRESIRDREAAEARARIRAERKANGEDEKSQEASEDPHAGVSSGDNIVRPVVLLRTNQTSGEASGDSSASPQRQLIPSAGENDGPPAKSEVRQVYMDDTDESNVVDCHNNEKIDELQQKVTIDNAEPVKQVETVSSSSHYQGGDASSEGNDAPLSEPCQSESLISESDQSVSSRAESNVAQSIKSERSDSNQPVVYDDVFHGNEEDRKREVAMEQQQKILRQVAATRASRHEVGSSHVRREIVVAPAPLPQEVEDSISESEKVPPKEDEPTPEMIAKAARAEYRRTRKPRTRGVLFRREPDGTLVNVDTEVQLRKTLDKKPRKRKPNHAKEKDNSSDLVDAPVTPEKESAPTPQANEIENSVKEQSEDRDKPFVPAPSPPVSAWQAGPPPGMRLSTSPLISRLSNEKENPDSLMTEEAYPTLSTKTDKETTENDVDDVETDSNNEQNEITCPEGVLDSTNETSGANLTASSDDEHSVDTSCRSPSDQGVEERTTEKKKFNLRRPSKRVPRKRPKGTFSRHSHHPGRRPHRHRPTISDSKRIAPAPVSSSDDDPASASVNPHKSSRRKVTSSRTNPRYRRPREPVNPSSKRATERYGKGKEKDSDDGRRPKPMRPRPRKTTRRREPTRATEEEKEE